jgi:hypothetical protein
VLNGWAGGLCSYPPLLINALACLSQGDILDSDRGSESDFGPSKKENENEAKELEDCERQKVRTFTREEKRRFIIVADGVRNEAAHPEQVRTK